MSVILVKKESDRIIIGSDSQESYGNDSQENILDSKLRKVENQKDVYIASAGNAHIWSILYAYAEENSLLKIKTRMDLIRYFSEFSDWVSDIINLGEEKIDPIELCQFIIIIKGKIWQFANYYIREIGTGEFGAIGSGAQSALACSKLNNSVETILKAVCSTNVHCSEPIKIIEIKI